MAVKRNNYDAVVALLDCGARNNILVQAPSSPFDGFSPLCLAVLNNNEQIAAEIIKHGVHINYPIITENHEGFANYTVLALARYNANVGMVKMLHKSGANINQLKAVKNVIYRPGASAQNIDEVSAYLKSCVGTSSSL